MAPHVTHAGHVVGVDISFDYMQRGRYEDDHHLVTSVATNRHAPFDDATREFLSHYLRDLQRRVEPFLTREQGRELEQYIDPEAACSFFNSVDLTVTCLDHVMRGITLREA